MIIGSDEKCCGCTACLQICPTNAITFVLNKKGFNEPCINSSKCVNCDLCSKVCPMMVSYKNEDSNQQIIYAAKRKNEELRMDSQSGGAFSAIAELSLKQGGVVYGVALNKDLQAIYKRADMISKLSEIKGSKYVQSDAGDIFSCVADDLKNGKKVVFSGTPCFVWGLSLYLKQKKINCDQLLLIDLICHGVPSPMIYRDYLRYIYKRYKARRVTGFNFRDKSFGWHSHFITYSIKNRKYVSKDYVDIFYSHYVLRDSCYHCPFSNFYRISDISVGDCWGVEKFCDDFSDNKGCSLIIVNTEKGKEVFDAIKEDLKYLKTCRENVLQPNLCHPSKPPVDVDDFWKDYELFGFQYATYKYCKIDSANDYELILQNQYLKRIRRKITGIIDRFL